MNRERGGFETRPFLLGAILKPGDYPGVRTIRLYRGQFGHCLINPETGTPVALPVSETSHGLVRSNA